VRSAASAVRVIGSPFKTLTAAEQACEAMLGYLSQSPGSSHGFIRAWFLPWSFGLNATRMMVLWSRWLATAPARSRGQGWPQATAGGGA
jgi:hypothetical protein